MATDLGKGKVCFRNMARDHFSDSSLCEILHMNTYWVNAITHTHTHTYGRRLVIFFIGQVIKF